MEGLVYIVACDSQGNWFPSTVLEEQKDKYLPENTFISLEDAVQHCEIRNSIHSYRGFQKVEVFSDCQLDNILEDCKNAYYKVEQEYTMSRSDESGAILLKISGMIDLLNGLKQGNYELYKKS
jgi:hypothetical protein